MARLLLLTAALLFVLPACGGKETAAPAEASGARRDADVQDLKAALDEGFVPLFDVRSRSEYYAAHVAGARLMPLAEIENAGRRTELEEHKGSEIWLICQSGGRSSKAADILIAEGYTVVNVAGGTGAWIAAGYPVD
ncbi:MAG: rhodanese-like domain-containing protein [Proteobacteria bacterium]|nr:rhodanese-like domain-containing protein [Pseudomonadota bacterium]